MPTNSCGDDPAFLQDPHRATRLVVSAATVASRPPARVQCRVIYRLLLAARQLLNRANPSHIQVTLYVCT